MLKRIMRWIKNDYETDKWLANMEAQKNEATDWMTDEIVIYDDRNPVP